MAASSKLIDRIRKLNALSTSSNPNEAARAAEERDRLMTRHGVTFADIDDEVIEVVDEAADAERLRLAKAIGISRRCIGLMSPRGQIGFRGRPSAARAARELYQTLVSDAVKHCEIGPQDPGRDTWRICFWIGFVDTVVARLLEDEVSAWTPPARKKRKRTVSGRTVIESEPPAAVVPTEIALMSATMQFAAHCSPMFAEMSINSVREEAYAAGTNFGRSRQIPEREKAPHIDRALGSRKDVS